MVSVRPRPLSSGVSLPISKTLVTPEGAPNVGTGVGMAVAGVAMSRSGSSVIRGGMVGSCWGRLVGVAEGVSVIVGVRLGVAVKGGVGVDGGPEGVDVPCGVWVGGTVLPGV
jgi:hypothetical protein